MDSFINYIIAHKNFFIFLIAFVVIYYILYLSVYGYPFKKNNKSYVEKLTNKKESKSVLIKKNKIEVKPYSNIEKDSWKEAFESLNDQALELENESEIEDLLKDNDLFFNDDDK